MKLGRRRRLRRLPKTEALRVHFARRVQERFGIVMNSKAIDDLVKEIQAGRFELVGRQSSRVTVWRVPVGDGRHAHVAYDSMRGVPITALYEREKIRTRPEMPSVASVLPALMGCITGLTFILVGG